MHGILRQLEGGDLRSIGRSNRIARAALADRSLVPVLVSGMSIGKPVVRMRCADALEKVTKIHPNWLSPHKAELLRLISQPQPREIRWHLLQMVPRVRWSTTDQNRLLQVLLQCVSDPSSIVKTFAMQALADLTTQAPRFLGIVKPRLKQLALAGTPAMRARGAKLLRNLNGG